MNIYILAVAGQTARPNWLKCMNVCTKCTLFVHNVYKYSQFLQYVQYVQYVLYVYYVHYVQYVQYTKLTLSVAHVVTLSTILASASSPIILEQISFMVADFLRCTLYHLCICYVHRILMLQPILPNPAHLLYLQNHTRLTRNIVQIDLFCLEVGMVLQKQIYQSFDW